jgi:hypothetical protein
MERLDWLVKKSKRQSVAVGRDFLRRAASNQASKAPLAPLLRGGRGGEVRLKLYLSILLLGVRKPHRVQLPPRSWAEILGLEDPDGNGARRVNDALRWLERHRLISTERPKGDPPIAWPLAEGGSGTQYVRPGDVKGYTWASLPVQFWQRGWILWLSSTAIAVLLILLELQRGKDSPETVAPRRLTERYGLSDESWSKGVSELKALGLVTANKATSGDHAERKRYRNNFKVVVSVFDDEPKIEDIGALEAAV